MNKEKLQTLVFEALREKPKTEFAAVESLIRDLSPDYQHHDALIVRGILWELLVQGILAPGINSSNLDFPWIHVTEFGTNCLEKDILLHAPSKYLKQLETKIKQPLDEIVLIYVRECLLTFSAGRYLAATVMLGVASERCLNLLIEGYLNAIADPDKKMKVEKKVKRAGRNTKRRFDTLRHELLVLSLPSEIKDTLDIQLSGIFTLIRYNRNDAGHPTEQIIDRDEAHANLLIFPQYCKLVYKLLDYFNSNSI